MSKKTTSNHNNNNSDDIADLLAKHIKKSNEAPIRDVLVKKFGPAPPQKQPYPPNVVSAISNICNPANGAPLLSWATKAGAETVVKMLVHEFGLDPTFAPKPSQHCCAFLDAVALSDDVLIRFFVEECPNKIKLHSAVDGRNGYNLFHIIAHSCGNAMMDFFVNDAPFFAKKKGNRRELVEMLLEKERVRGDTALAMCAASKPDQLLEPLRAIAEYFEDEEVTLKAAAAKAAATANSENVGDDDEERKKSAESNKAAATSLKSLRAAVTNALYPALHQLLSFSEVGNDRVVKIFALAVDRLDVSPVARICFKELADPSSSSSNSNDDSDDDPPDCYQSLVHRAVLSSENNNCATLLRVMLRSGIKISSSSSSNRTMDSDRKRQESLRALRWMHELTDYQGESLLSYACDHAIGREAMSILLSCTSIDCWYMHERQKKQFAADDATGVASDSDKKDSDAVAEAVRVLSASIEELLTSERLLSQVSKESQAQSYVAARLATAQALVDGGVLFAAGEMAALEKLAKQTLGDWAREAASNLEKKRKQKADEQAAAAAAAASIGDYSGTSSIGEPTQQQNTAASSSSSAASSAADRARAAALKQAQAKKAALTTRKEKEKAAAAAASAGGEDNDDAEQEADGSADKKTAAGDDDDDAAERVGSAAEKPKPKGKGKISLTSTKKKTKHSEGRSLDEVHDEEDDNNQDAVAAAAESSDEEEKESAKKKLQQANSDSPFQTVTLLMFAIAFIIVFFFLSAKQ